MFNLTFSISTYFYDSIFRSLSFSKLTCFSLCYIAIFNCKSDVSLLFSGFAFLNFFGFTWSKAVVKLDFSFKWNFFFFFDFVSSIIYTFTNVNYSVFSFFYNLFFSLCIVNLGILDSVSYLLRSLLTFSNDFYLTFFKCRIFFYFCFKRNFFSFLKFSFSTRSHKLDFYLSCACFNFTIIFKIVSCYWHI